MLKTMPGTKTIYGFPMISTDPPLGYLSRGDKTPREEGSPTYQNLLDRPAWVLLPGKSPEV